MGGQGELSRLHPGTCEADEVLGLQDRLVHEFYTSGEFPHEGGEVEVDVGFRVADAVLLGSFAVGLAVVYKAVRWLL